MLEGHDNNAFYAFGVPFYILIMLWELWLSKRKGVVAYGFGDTMSTFHAGFGEVVVGLFLGPVLIGLYVFGYEHLRLITWPEGSWIPWVIAFFAADFGYWLYHY